MTDGLTSSQAARILDLSKARVVQLNNEGRLPATHTALGRLFDPRVVERFAEARALARAS